MRSSSVAAPDDKSEPHHKFSSWLFCKFKKKDRKRLTSVGEPPVSSTKAGASHGYHGGKPGGSGQPTFQRQQSFLRQQLLEMKRQSAEALVQVQKKVENGTTRSNRGSTRSTSSKCDNQKEQADEDMTKSKKNDGESEDDDDDDEVVVVVDDDEEMKIATSESNQQQEQDEQQARKDENESSREPEKTPAAFVEAESPAAAMVAPIECIVAAAAPKHKFDVASNQVKEDSDDEDERDEPPMRVFDEMDDGDKRRSLISEEANRHLSQATQLYAEALNHLQRAQASLFRRPSTPTRSNGTPSRPSRPTALPSPLQPQPEPQPKPKPKARKMPISEWI